MFDSTLETPVFHAFNTDGSDDDHNNNDANADKSMTKV